MDRKRLFITLGIFLLLVVGIGLTVYITQQQTKEKSSAAPSSVLSFDATQKAVTPGKEFTTDITLDPGQNLVNFLTLIVKYDGTKLSPVDTGITPNTAAFSQIIDGPSAPTCTTNDCSILVSLGTGTDITRVISTKMTIGTLRMKALEGTSGTSEISFGSGTVAYATGNENNNVDVLTAKTPINITLGESQQAATASPTLTARQSFTSTNTPTPLVCVSKPASCEWDAVSNATRYHYKITDANSSTVIKQGDVNAPTTSISFLGDVGKTYTCEVLSANVCGENPNVAKTTKTCTVSPTPTNTPAPSATPTTTPRPTNTPVPSITPTPTIVTAYVQPTNTPYPAQPTLAPTGPGNIWMNVGAFGAAVLVIGGTLIFFAL